MAKKKIDVEIMKLGPDHIMKWLDQLYDLVVEDSPILEWRCCTALAESEIRLWWWPRYVRA